MEAEHDPYQAPAATAQVLEPRDRVSTWLRLAVGCYVASSLLRLPALALVVVQRPHGDRLAYGIVAIVMFLGLGLFVTCMVRWLRQESWRARRWVVLWAFVEGGYLAYILWPPLAPVLDLALELPASLVRIAAGVFLVLPGVGARFPIPGDPRS